MNLLTKLLRADLGTQDRTFFSQANRDRIHKRIGEEVKRLSGYTIGPQDDENLQLIQYRIFQDYPSTLEDMNAKTLELAVPNVLTHLYDYIY